MKSILNEKKTKWMILSWDPGQNTKIIVNNKEIEKVKEFRYLGRIITENLSPEVEVKQRIRQAKTAFLKMKNFLKNRSPNLKSRQRLLKCYIYSSHMHSKNY